MIQMEDADDGQWETVQKAHSVVVGRLTTQVADGGKRLKKRVLDAILIGTEGAAREIKLVLVRPEKDRVARITDDKNIKGLLRMMRMDTNGWMILKLE